MRTDANHIALEKTRSLLSLLRKSALWNSSSTEVIDFLSNS